MDVDTKKNEKRSEVEGWGATRKRYVFSLCIRTHNECSQALVLFFSTDKLATFHFTCVLSSSTMF